MSASEFGGDLKSQILRPRILRSLDLRFQIFEIDEKTSSKWCASRQLRCFEIPVQKSKNHFLKRSTKIVSTISKKSSQNRFRNPKIIDKCLLFFLSGPPPSYGARHVWYSHYTVSGIKIYIFENAPN